MAGLPLAAEDGDPSRQSDNESDCESDEKRRRHGVTS